MRAGAEADASEITRYHRSGADSLKRVAETAGRRERPYILDGFSLARQGIERVVIDCEDGPTVFVRTRRLQDITLMGGEVGSLTVNHEPKTPGNTAEPSFVLELDKITGFSYRQFSPKPPLEVVGSELKLHPFHDGLLIATTTDFEAAGIRGVSINHKRRDSYIPSSALFAMVANLEREELTFWTNEREGRALKLCTETFSTNSTEIEFLQVKAKQQAPTAVA